MLKVKSIKAVLLKVRRKLGANIQDSFTGFDFIKKLDKKPTLLCISCLLQFYHRSR